MSFFFYLSKKFDRVWHAGLLTKLHHFGVHGSAHAWLTAYLTGRRQRMKIDNSFSSWSTIPAGDPQRSVLGPLLFLIYTIDLPAACSNSNTICSQFADDTAIIAISKNFLHERVKPAGSCYISRQMASDLASATPPRLLSCSFIMQTAHQRDFQISPTRCYINYSSSAPPS